MSGHSKWATIKHKKAIVDAKRGRAFTKLIKEITVAARMGGGDPGGNPRLRKAIDDAKGQQMPADTIKRAVQRGTGELEGASYEEILYEGTGPSGTLFMLEAMTDNRNRTVAEIRKIFERHNGALGAGGTAAWAFDRKGIVLIEKGHATEDQLMETAVGAGADDYSDAGDDWQILCEPSVFDAVQKSLEAAKIKVKSANLGYVPKTKREVSGRDAELCINLAEALDEHDDAQNVHSDFDVSDEEMARIAG
jgi:YebC/PmpR family DNA-binding regulatory protein